MSGGSNVKSLFFNLDFRSGVPSYVQIVEQVQAYLANGELKPGDQLPTVRQLASELRVNFNTIARAYRMLDEAGLISTQQGRGTYLLDQPSAEAIQKLKKETLELQSKRFLKSLAKQGFSAEESQQTLQLLFRSWQDGTLEQEPDNESL
ncbi:MAG: GntR family transcriptional regulator [Chloroflexi bacterium HGW-Chloroflexi-5]|nr:MAG: GntR family transcriptional regulator [Chloroflexi bacterium HGW-Chloroflexi-5]